MRVARTAALYTTREMSALRSRAVGRRVARTGPLDGAVQLGTGYSLPDGLRIATYEDMTVPQALSLPYPEWQELSDTEVAARIEGQRRAYRQATACCFTSTWAAESAVRDCGVPEEKVHVVGIGWNRAPSPRERDWSKPRFLFVGGDWQRKNGDAVVRVFKRLRERVPEAALDVVGNHPPVDIAGVAGHGWLSPAVESERRELERLFAAATCFVMPSLFEPAGIVYLEAAKAGTPSIGTTVGGSRYLIGDGGVVVDPGDDNALLRAMLELSTPSAAREAGERARRRAEHFSWRAVAERIVAVLDGGARAQVHAPDGSESPLAPPRSGDLDGGPR